MTVQCCVCKKIRVSPSIWKISEEEIHEEVSHGYCEPCAAKAFAEIRQNFGDKSVP